MIDAFNALHDALHVVKYRPVTLSNGEQSDWYIDGRMMSMHPLARSVITNIFMYQLPYDLQDVSLGGPATAAIPLITELSSKTMQPSFYVRKNTKGHGLQNQIEGHLTSKAILIDDTLHSGDSLIQCAEILRNKGTEVDQALVVYDRRNKEATNKLNEAGLNIFAIKEIKIDVTKPFGYMPPTAEYGMHLT